MTTTETPIKSKAECIQALTEALQKNDRDAFVAALNDLNKTASIEIINDVREVADNLQSALEQFRQDSRLVDLAENQVPDARQRLSYVLKLTDDAAHQTIDLIDKSSPVIEKIASGAEKLLGDELETGGQFRATKKDVTLYLAETIENSKTLRDNLHSVLMAQEFQDLSGQVIRNVMKLTDELENVLGTLISIGNLKDTENLPKIERSTNGNGPLIPGLDNSGAVGNQQDIDSMLSDLGL